jgi:thiol-disulfide isomerase/thioredoxin
MTSRPRLAPRAWQVVASLALFVLSVMLDRVEAYADPSRFVPWSRPDTPALALKDLDGRERSLADYRGTVLLVNFWATWCEPCRDEMPSMGRLRTQLAGHPFDVLAVNYGESATRVRDFVTKERLDLTVLLDAGQNTARAWRVRTLPSSFLVGPDGRVRYSVVGELDWARDDTVTLVRSILPVRGAAVGGVTGRLAGRAGR